VSASKKTKVSEYFQAKQQAQQQLHSIVELDEKLQSNENVII